MIIKQAKISQNDLYIGQAELELISKCINNRWLTEGPFVKQLSEKVSSLLDVKYVTFAPNGTLGLFLALLALDLPKGSEIIIPSFTFYASATSAIFAGLKPVFVDVDLNTFNMIPEEVEKAITSQTSAIMPVHIYGQSCNISKICQIAEKHNLKVIEDAAQAIGVKHQGKDVGSFGDLGVFSFFSDKIITTGEGAAIVTNNEELFKKIKLLRNQGREHAGTFIHPELGMNFRITDLQAAIGISQISKFDQIVQERLVKWKLYEELLAHTPHLQFMKIADFSNLIPFRFCIRTNKKNDLCNFLEQEGIATRSFFYPMHKQPKLKEYRALNCKNAELLYDQGICLPIHHHLTLDDIRHICTSINNFINQQ